MMTNESSVPAMAVEDDEDPGIEGEGDDENEIHDEEPAKKEPVKAKKEKKVKAKKEKPKGKAPAKAKAEKRSLKSVPAKRGRQARTELTPENATKAEMKILRLVYSPKGERQPFTIKEIQKKAFGGTNTSRTRNTLRPLVKFGWIEQVEGINPETKKPYRGTYRLTEKGRKRGLEV